MTLPDSLQKTLPGDTAQVWETIRDLVPDSAYLAGGTAVVVHLRHRISRDLDFFLTRPTDLDKLRGELSRRGQFNASTHTTDTLNGQFSNTKLQFLEAANQRVLEPFLDVEGLRVAGLGDLLATKLHAVGGRGELRDYFDLKKIEELGSRTVEEGLGLLLARYQPTVAEQALLPVIRGLGFFDDVREDPSLPEPRETITTYWQRRQPEIIQALDRLRLS